MPNGQLTGGRLSRRKKRYAAPADCAPGSCLMRSSNSFKRACGRVGIGRTHVVKPETEKSSSAMTTCSGRNPRSVESSFAKLCNISPAPTRSTVASATSATTSQLRVRPAETPPDALRLLSFNTSFKSGREHCHAGASPKTTPVNNAALSVKHNARLSTDTSPSRGMFAGLAATNAFTPQ